MMENKTASHEGKVIHFDIDKDAFQQHPQQA